jgi:hypothetical protein
MLGSSAGIVSCFDSGTRPTLLAATLAFAPTLGPRPLYAGNYELVFS